MKIAIIGTAGRDKLIPMSKELWRWMIRDVSSDVREDDTVISGGAAWADHLAVELFLTGKCKDIILHLPAPFCLQTKRFSDAAYNKTSRACNFYHEKFSQIIGYDSLRQIAEVIDSKQFVTYEPKSNGYSGMFGRNDKVAAGCDFMLAYTFGRGDIPKDGGTKYTWDKCKVRKQHIALPMINSIENLL
jgi:hypothetical protein